jgi:hypothetical protein
MNDFRSGLCAARVTLRTEAASTRVVAKIVPRFSRAASATIDDHDEDRSQIVAHTGTHPQIAIGEASREYARRLPPLLGPASVSPARVVIHPTRLR